MSKSKRHIVTFSFKSSDAAQEFVTWMCESGEQAYFEWEKQALASYVEDGIETWPETVSFDYHTANSGTFGTSVIAYNDAEYTEIRKIRGY